MIVLLKSSGFSLDEIFGMTLTQLKLYTAAIVRKEKKEFLLNLNAALYGSRGDEESLKEVTQKFT